ncbi:mitoregulin [Paroedura picta]|uniref:mitoregulin n=1 Tax=Paroedura picta TaxID=143630 RepID=UPI004056C882
MAATGGSCAARPDPRLPSCRSLRRGGCRGGSVVGRMALGSEALSERPVQLAVLLAFASGVLVGWQANRMRRRYLDWRKRRLQDQLSATQKKLDLS